MELAQAVSKIAELPKILEQYGIAPEDVLTIEYNVHKSNETQIVVHLFSRESIEKLGDFHAKNTVDHNGVSWTHYKVFKEGISFACCKPQQDCINIG